MSFFSLMATITSINSSSLNPQQVIFVMLDRPTSLVYGFTVAEILFQRDYLLSDHRRHLKTAGLAAQAEKEDFPAPEFPPEAHESLTHFLSPDLLPAPSPPPPTPAVEHFQRLGDIILRIDKSLPQPHSDEDFIVAIKNW